MRSLPYHHLAVSYEFTRDLQSRLNLCKLASYKGTLIQLESSGFGCVLCERNLLSIWSSSDALERLVTSVTPVQWLSVDSGDLRQTNATDLTKVSCRFQNFHRSIAHSSFEKYVAYLDIVYCFCQGQVPSAHMVVFACSFWWEVRSGRRKLLKD